MDGVCAAAAGGILGERRKHEIERIASGYTPAQKAAFMALQFVARTYFHLHETEEVDFAGSAGRAFEIEDFVHRENILLRDIDALEADKVPESTAGAAQRADAHLQAVYHRVLANPALQPSPPDPLLHNVPMTHLGTITSQGIRVDQALWLSYRDAWTHFAAAVKPSLAPGTVRAWITEQRVQDLRCLLPVHDKDFRSCHVPALSPSALHR